MEILVCKDYDEFINKVQQIDKQVNGVSEEFLKQHRISIKNYLAMCQNSFIEHCFNCWNCEDCEKCINCESCIKCKECNGCEECVECNICEKCIGSKNCEVCEKSNWCEKCIGCKGFSFSCLNCKDCENCSNCLDCVKCKNCEKMEHVKDVVNPEEEYTFSPREFQEYLNKEYNGDYFKYKYCEQ